MLDDHRNKPAKKDHSVNIWNMKSLIGGSYNVLIYTNPGLFYCFRMLPSRKKQNMFQSAERRSSGSMDLYFRIKFALHHLRRKK